MSPLLTIVALVAAGLAGLVGFELLPSTTDADPVPPAVSAAVPSAAAVTAAPLMAPVAAVSDDTLLARPLFSQTRRPPNVAGPAAAAVAGTAPLPRMTAILIDGPDRRAIFAGSNGKAVTVVEGGRVGAFTVQSIGPRQVTLIGPDGPRTVRTTFDPGLQPPAPVPVAGFVLPQFPGIQIPGIQIPGSQIPGAPMPLPPNPPYNQPTTPAVDVGSGSSPGAAR